MKEYIKNGSKVLFDYVTSLILFVVFLYVFMSLAKDNFGVLLPYYSLLLFLFAFFVIYNDMKRLALKEKKPQYELHPYPLKGLVYGLLGIVPIALPVAVAALIPLGNEASERIKELAINTFLGPVFFMAKWFDESVLGYIAAILLIPLISTLGYLAGYYGIEIMGKLKKKKALPEKGFAKSPWNPSNIPDKASAKKKKHVKKNPQNADEGK